MSDVEIEVVEAEEKEKRNHFELRLVAMIIHFLSISNTPLLYPSQTRNNVHGNILRGFVQFKGQSLPLLRRGGWLLSSYCSSNILMENKLFPDSDTPSVKNVDLLYDFFDQSTKLVVLPRAERSTTCRITFNHSFLNLSHCNFSKFFIPNFLPLLFGSFFFLGFFNVRNAVAIPAQTITMDEKNDTEEEEMREKILEHEPRNIDTLKSVIYEKMRRGKTEESIKYVQRLIDLEPDEVEWRLLLALCHEMMGQLDKAKDLFMEILKERPLLVRALHGLALVMHNNHEGQFVFQMLNKSLDIAHREKKVTEERNIRILIAQMHVVKGELEEGLKKFQDLVDENPHDFRPYLCQGIIYSLLDKKKEAAEQFETYQALVPDEFPQREFIDDIVSEAKIASPEQFQKEFDAEFSYKK